MITPHAISISKAKGNFNKNVQRKRFTPNSFWRLLVVQLLKSSLFHFLFNIGKNLTILTSEWNLHVSLKLFIQFTPL
mgnify:CR=1 FL=1